MAKKAAKLDIRAIREAQHLASLRTMDGNTTMVSGDNNRMAGLPIPFALEYLFDVNILPMGVLFHIYGEKDNNKTTLYWEFCRLVQDYAPRIELYLTEGKVSPGLAYMLMGYPWEGLPSHIKVHKLGFMEEWQAASLQMLQRTRTLFKKGIKAEKVPAGAYSPIVLGVDSLTGQLLSGTNDTIAATGAPERRYATEAKSLTDYLKSLANELVDLPAFVFAINHMKVVKGITDFQNDKRTIGGAQVKFQATYEIELHQGPQIVTTDPDPNGGLFIKGHNVTLTSDKNSLGEKKRKVTVPYRWRYVKDERNGVKYQRAWFDWDAALVGVIMSQFDERQSDKLGKGRAAFGREKLDAVIHLRSETANTFSSKTLGISPADALPASQIGKLIADDPNIIEGLRNELGIKRYTIWNPNEQCFFELQKRLSGEISANSVKTPARKGPPVNKIPDVYTRSKNAADMRKLGALDATPLNESAKAAAEEARVLELCTPTAPEPIEDENPKAGKPSAVKLANKAAATLKAKPGVPIAQKGKPLSSTPPKTGAITGGVPLKRPGKLTRPE